MKKIRLSTLQLVIVILALSLALLIQHQQAVRREARLRAEAEDWEAAASVSEAKFKDLVTKSRAVIQDLGEKLNEQQPGK